MSQLDARMLSVSLGGKSVLHQIDLAIPPGSFVGLVGPNGAGKSTLMRALAGLVSFSGDVRIGGRSLQDLADKERARHIAYMAQSREIAWPITVEEVVALGRLPHRPPFTGLGEADIEVIEQVVGKMDLGDVRSRLATELSGGETARVMTARVLAQDTDIVIADEPTAGLDPAHQLNLMQIFRERAAEGRTVFMSLHELGLAARWCQRLVLLDRGRIVADGPPETVLTPENLKTVYRIDAFLGRDDGGLLLVPTGISP